MFLKLIIYVVVLSIFNRVANGSVETNSKAKCAEINEYCQNHWDCCSGSCLSYSYKCVRSNRPAVINTVDIIPPQIGGVNPPSCVGAGQYCQYHWDCCSQSCLTYSHKCIGNTVPPPPQHPFNSLLELSQAQPVGDEAGSNDLDNYSVDEISNEPDSSITLVTIQQDNNLLKLKSLPGVSSNTNCLAIGNRCANGPDCCSLNCKYSVCMTGYNQLNGPEHLNKPCLEIGKKCYRHDECCTGRCHGYLHQCVT